MAKKLPSRRRPLIEEIEPRILYSADFSPGLLQAAPLASMVEQRTLDAGGEFAASSNIQQNTVAAEHARHEVVFVDTATPDYQKLVDDIRAQAGQERRLDVVLLDGKTDGIEQISGVLAGQKDISAIHIISHGSDGEVQLGGSTLNFDSLLKNATQIKGWGQALSADADVLIYGCDVAQAPDGKAMIDALSRLTGAEVAASEDLTGAADQGGNWTLEYNTGHIDAQLALSYAMQMSWEYTLATYTVTSTVDDLTAGTLRTAITNANANGGTDTINFAIGAGGAQTITLGSLLPDITGTVILDASTQTGFAGTPLITLDGNDLLGSGFTLTSTADSSTIRGFVIKNFAVSGSTLGNGIWIQSGSDGNTIAGNNVGRLVADGVARRNFGNGIQIEGANNIIGGLTALDRNIISGNRFDGIDVVGAGATGNRIIGNYIGTGIDGTSDLGNTEHGIHIDASNNTVGGLTASARNIISGNENEGIDMRGTSTGNLIVGNYIGTDVNGTADLGNFANGIFIGYGASSNTVGGLTSDARNVLSGNEDDGMEVQELTSTNNVIIGNYIGVDKNGSALGNASDGVVLENSNNNTIGGTAAGAGNVIAFNAGVGVNILIGGTGHVIQGNSIYSNVSIGIDLGDNGVNANDVNDTDGTFNNLQNYPVVTSAKSANGSIIVIGTLNSTASTVFRIEFFASTTGDATNGEGERYLGFVDVMTDGSSNVSYTTTLTGVLTASQTVISATATDPSGNTSEFSVNVTGAIVNSTPAGTNNTVTVLEDAIYTFAAVDFGFTDPNDSPADALTAVRITTMPGVGSLTLSGATVTAGQTITVANINSGNLKFAGVGNANGAAYTTFTFQVQDDGGTVGGGVDLDQSANTMTLNVTAVNDAPAGTDTTVTTLEDTQYTFSAANFGFTDPIDSPANALTAVRITTMPGVGSLTLSGATVTAGQTITVADINSGNLKFAAVANAAGAGYTTFTFQVQDDGLTANSGVDLDQSANTMTLNVTAVNDAPAGTDTTVTTLEDTQYTFSAANFGFTDPIDSPANALTAVMITAMPGAGSLTLSGATVTAGQTITVADINSGNLKFAAVANANGAGYTTFTFQVQDDGLTANSGVDLDQSANTMTLNVTAVNDAPAGTDTTVTTLEDTQYTFSAANFGFTDPIDSPANALTAVMITAMPGAGSLTLFGATVTAGQTITVADINSGNLKFAAVANANGAAYTTFTFQVQDDGLTANSGVDLDQSANTMTLNVTAVNDAPAGTDTTVTTLEDTQYTFSAANFGFTDPIDSPANALTAVRITTMPGAGSLTLSGATVTAGQTITVADINSGNLKFAAVTDGAGAGYASFTFQVQDDGLTANSGVDLDQSANTMTLNVTGVNDAPSGTDTTVTALEDTQYTFSAASFGFTDPIDSPANALTAVRITAMPGAGSLTLSGTTVTAGQTITVADINSGNLKFAAVANANGAAYTTFTFQVQDDGLTANSGVDLDQSANTMTLNVTAVNDAPAGTDTTVTTLEDTQYTFSAANFGFTDPIDSPANALTAVRITTMPGAGSLTLSGATVTAGQTITVADINSGNLKFAAVANANGAGYTTFTFQVQDDGLTANSGVDLDQSANTMTLNVTAVNDAPAGTDTTVTALEDTQYTFSAANFGLTDPIDSPANALTAVMITTMPGVGSLTLSGATVTAGQTITVADINSGNLKFAAVANANGAAYTIFTFQVQDDGLTANGGVDLDQSANTMTLNVTAVNDAPAGTDTTVTTLEDTQYTFSAANFGFTDPIDSPANALTAVRITAMPGAGSLTLSGATVTAGQTITVADINSGNLKFAAVANANGAAYTTFTFQVQDDGGTVNSGIDLDASANTMTVNVTAVNDAPVGADNTVTTLEQTDYTFAAVDFGFTDPIDSAANALTAVMITTMPGVGSLTLSGATVTAGQTITVANINSGNLKFAPVTDGAGVGYASFTFQVQDDGLTANSGVDLDQSANTMTLNVTAVNDAPAGTDTTVTALEDTQYTFSAANFGFTDPIDSPANALAAVRITTMPGVGSLTLSGATVTGGQTITVADINSGNLKFAAVANANGTAYTTFTFQVQDDGLTANSGVDLDQSANTMTLNVTAVNDAPVGANTTISTLEDTAYTFATADFGFSDPGDSPANVLSAVEITTAPASGSLTLSGVAISDGQLISVANITSGNLQFTPGANSFGVANASFTFKVQDDGGSASGGVNVDQSARIVSIDVTAVNDAPVIGNNVLTVAQGGSVILSAADVSASDVELASLSFTLSGVSNGYFELVTNQGVSIAGFSEADISAGQVRFVHDGSAIAPAYSLAVSDGTLLDGPTMGTVNFSLSAPPPSGGPVIPPAGPPPPPPAPTPTPVAPPPAPAPDPGDTSSTPSGDSGDSSDEATAVDAPAVAPPSGGVPTASVEQPSVRPTKPTSSNVRSADWRGFGEGGKPLAGSFAGAAAVQQAELSLLVHGMDPRYTDFGPTAQTNWTVQTPFSDDKAEQTQEGQLTVLTDSTQVGGIALSVGAVWWASRITGLVGGLLASVPAWSRIDPLLVVGRDEEYEVDWDNNIDHDADADELAISMVLDGARAGSLAQA